MNSSLLQRQARNGSQSKSPNGYSQVSRAHRVQMNYNLQSSKTIGGPAPQLQVNLIGGSASQFYSNPVRSMQPTNTMNLLGKSNPYAANSEQQMLQIHPTQVTQIARDLAAGKTRNAGVSIPKFSSLVKSKHDQFVTK